MLPACAVNASTSTRHRGRWGVFLLAAVLPWLTGCPDSTPEPTNEPVKRPLAGIELKLAVVDDPAIAAAVEELRGEWNAQTGSTFSVESVAEADVTDGQTLPADALIAPAHLLGPLAERKLLAAVPDDQLDKTNWTGVFELLKLREATWGPDAYGVAFGSPVLVCYYRADLLKQLDRKPPQTWAEYQELAELLTAQKPGGGSPDDDPASDTLRHGTVEPLATGWAGLVLLARAAPYARHRSFYSTLFDIDSMEPLVAGPPFVKALEELVAAATYGPPEQLDFDPAAARRAFWQGQAAMALSWPTAAAEDLPDKPPADAQVGFVELPGSPVAYNHGNEAWEDREETASPHVPLLSVAGRIGLVGSQSAHVDAAFRLLFWLSDEQNSPAVSATSPATTLFRPSQAADPTVWVEPQLSAESAAGYAETTVETFARQQWLVAPRIPGRAKYLAALDAAVQQAVRGEKSPQEALDAAAAEWRRITAKLGPDSQKAAYLHSLGLD